MSTNIHNLLYAKGTLSWLYQIFWPLSCGIQGHWSHAKLSLHVHYTLPAKESSLVLLHLQKPPPSQMVASQ